MILFRKKLKSKRVNMEQVQRIVLYAALIIVAFFLWQSWNKFEQKIAATVANNTPVLQQPTTGFNVNNTPAASTLPSNTAVNNTAITPTKLNVKENIPSNRLVQIHTDVLNITIDTLGGNIISLNLPKYPISLDQPNTPFTLLTSDPRQLYIAESALMGSDGPDNVNQLAQYNTPQNTYTMNGDTLVVNLNWSNKAGLDVTKTYTFTKGSYLINVAYTIKNNSNKVWTGSYYTQLTRKEIADTGNHLFQIHPYFGAAISTPNKPYQEVSFKDMQKQPIQQSIQSGWAAMVQRYFVSAWIPETNTTYNYYSNVANNDVYTIGMSSQPITVAPGQTQTVTSKIYSGPEITSVLKNIAPGLEQTVSYGWLWFISVIIFWVMEKIYSVVGNWGWSIIIVTIFIKLMFYHLSAKSYSSMAKMRGLQPKIQALRERYADDKQKQSQAMMELYKTEKVNPVGGCLPIVVQIPVFFALYMVLIESVQLRQAPWIFWIHDLSVPDPFFVLPVLMAITMFIQQKLNPAPPDPTQAKVMMFLPVVFGFLFAYFPAGLVLYWVVNNGLSILQQWHITRKYEKKAVTNKIKVIKKS